MKEYRCRGPLNSGKKCPDLDAQLLTVSRPRNLGDRPNECLVIGLAPGLGTRRLPRADREKLLLRKVASPFIGRENLLSDGISQITVSFTQIGNVIVRKLTDFRIGEA